MCYEAGPSGYDGYRQCTALGVACQGMAFSRTPRMPGDRIKIDRCDVCKLGHLFQSGDLTPITISELRGHPTHFRGRAAGFPAG